MHEIFETFLCRPRKLYKSIQTHNNMYAGRMNTTFFITTFISNQIKGDTTAVGAKMYKCNLMFIKSKNIVKVL